MVRSIDIGLLEPLKMAPTLVAENTAPPPATESTHKRLVAEEFTDDALATAPPRPVTDTKVRYTDADKQYRAVIT